MHRYSLIHIHSHTHTFSHIRAHTNFNKKLDISIGPKGIKGYEGEGEIRILNLIGWVQNTYVTLAFINCGIDYKSKSPSCIELC